MASRVALNTPREVVANKQQPNKAARPSWRPTGTLKFVKDTWKAYHGSSATIIDEEALARHKITISSLNFTTGRVDDGSLLFVEPYAVGEIENALLQYKPWNRVGVHTTFGPDPTHTNIWQARYLHHYFECLLTGNQDERKHGLIGLTPWEIEWPQPEECLYSDKFKTGVDWACEVEFDMNDPAIPHKTCYVLDEVPFTDGVLATSELMCILAITAGRLMSRTWKHHKTIPVTVIAASEMKLRITQSFVDSRDKYRIRVYMTRIIDFTAGPTETWDNVLTVLAWMIGRPLGKTI